MQDFDAQQLGLQQQPSAALIEQRIRVEARVRGGASWFFIIAALSLINTGIMMSGSSWHFIFGLGITDIVTAIAVRAGGPANVAGLIIDVIIAGVMALLGMFSRKPKKWAFIVGMVLYALDGILVLLFKDFLGLAFHAYALFRIYQGFSAISELEALKPQAAAAAAV